MNETSIKIYLDDEREAPNGYVRTHSVNETTKLIEESESNNIEITEINVDHDLGDYANDGGDAIKLLDWLVERGTFYPIVIHTMNVVGRANMQRMIDRFWNDIEIPSTIIEPNIETSNDKEKLKKDYFQKIDNNQNFYNFIVDKTNAKPFEAASACTTNPGIVYNPLFIYGKSGMGKTHLLNAIANSFISNIPSNKVSIINGAELKKRVEEYVKEERLNELTNDLINLDVLLIDDFQFIANNSKTQETLNYVFDNLLNNRKQIIITANKHIEEIEGIEDRLASRITGGLITKILELKKETAVNIIKTKISNLTISKKFNDDVIDYLATNYAQDVRSIEGALNRLIFYFFNYSTDAEQITLELVEKAFEGLTNHKN